MILTSEVSFGSAGYQVSFRRARLTFCIILNFCYLHSWSALQAWWLESTRWLNHFQVIIAIKLTRWRCMIPGIVLARAGVHFSSAHMSSRAAVRGRGPLLGPIISEWSHLSWYCATPTGCPSGKLFLVSRLYSRLLSPYLECRVSSSLA